MNLMDKNVLESAPFGYIQLKPISKDKTNSQSSGFLSSNIAFENITGLKRAHLLHQKESDFVSGLKSAGLEHLSKYYDKTASQRNEAMQEFEYFSDFTKRFYKAQPWITEGNILHCTFVETMDRKQFAKNEEHYLKGFEYDAIIEELNQTNKELNTALIETVKQKEEKHLILDSISDIVLHLDIQMNIVWGNKSATQVAGQELKNIIGKPCYQIYSNENRICEGCPVHKAIEIRSQSSAIQERYNGRIWNILATPVFDVQGEITGIVETIKDITTERLAEQEIKKNEEKLSITLNSIGDGVIATDINGLIEGMNPIAETLCGWNFKDVKGKPLQDIFHIINSTTRKPVSNAVKKVLESGQMVGLANHTILISREGIERQIADSAAPIRNKEGELKGVVLVFSDVTENYALMEKIKTSDRIFNHSIDMLCIAGFDGFFKVLNPAWTKGLGWSEEELLSKPWLEFVHPDDKAPTANVKKTRLDNGVEVYQFENRYICKDNSVKWLSWNSFPYPEEQIMFGVARDITLQKQADIELRSNEEKYRLLFEKSPLGILHFDTRGLVVSCNEQLTKILRLPSKIITGYKLSKFPDKSFVKLLKKVLNGENVTFQGDYTSVKGKKTTPVRLVASPLTTSEGIIEGGIAIIEDHTNQIQKTNLEKKVAIAEESVKFKQRFLANMSHEIRTPLTGILGMVEILEQTKLTKNQSDYLTTLKYSGDNLREIINLILDFSKIEAGKVALRKESFELKKMFLEAKSLFQSICTKPIVYETQIDTHIPEHIYADKSRILQIVNNFISNAVKFTEEGKISISADLIKNKAGRLEIKVCVTDTGQGIPEEEQKLLFAPFTQVDQSYSRSFEGTGLGLSICKELAKLHGGEVGLESEPGKGSTFWFTFQAKKSKEIPVCPEIEIQHTSKKAKAIQVLLAEDKIVNQKVFGLMLKSLGHEITFVNNGLEFLETYQPGLFDIIFMDIQMPEMDGLTAIEKIRETYQDLPPIVGLSANAFEGDREKYMGMGMDEYLIKPVKKDDFCRVLDLFFVQE